MQENIQIFKRFATALGEVTLRTYAERDYDVHMNYLFDSPKDFLNGIGFDTAKLGLRAEWEAGFRLRCAQAAEKGLPPTIAVAEINGCSVAMIFLDLYQEDKIPRLHFHVMQADLRGQGLGGPIFMAGVEAFYKIYGFGRILIEPRATNQPMNALMRKLGFKYLCDSLLPAGPMTREMTVSRYEILPFSID